MEPTFADFSVFDPMTTYQVRTEVFDMDATP